MVDGALVSFVSILLTKSQEPYSRWSVMRSQASRCSCFHSAFLLDPLGAPRQPCTRDGALRDSWPYDARATFLLEAPQPLSSE